MNVRELGEYIRGQRNGARLSLRNMSGLAGVSIPYLSQIERGLRKPSAEVLQGIAKGLRISAEQLYVKAGILEARPPADVAAAIMDDLTITERQKQALVQIYEAFREETGRAVPEPSVPSRTRTSGARRSAAGKPAAPRATARSGRKPAARTVTAASRRAGTRAAKGASS